MLLPNKYRDNLTPEFYPASTMIGPASPPARMARCPVKCGVSRICGMLQHFADMNSIKLGPFVATLDVFPIAQMINMAPAPSTSRHLPRLDYGVASPSYSDPGVAHMIFFGIQEIANRLVYVVFALVGPILFELQSSRHI